MVGFSAAVKRQVFRRDKECVPCTVKYGVCVSGHEALVVHHRANRGMGGSPSADTVENGLLVCSSWNFLVESSASKADEAREHGWKVPRNSVTPLCEVPVYVMTDSGPAWVLFDTNGGRVVVS